MSEINRSRVQINRREAIRLMAIGGAAIGLSCLEISRLLSENCLKEVRETRLLMGSLATLSVVTENSNIAKVAIENAFYRMNELISILDHRCENSEVSVLNTKGYLKGASEALVELIKISQEVNRSTMGAFDITIHPLCRLYRDRAREGLLPSEEEISQTLEKIGMKRLHIDSNTIQFECPGMAITLDGIGKGYVIDAGVFALKENGVPNVMVEVGGDIMASGHNASQSEWRIGVRSPREWKRESVILNVYDEAVATSGDYLNFYIETFQEHHIIDPRTGHSCSELASVTVVASTAVQADALATALMVMNTEEGVDLVNSLNGVEAFWVTKDMNIHKTTNLAW